MCSVASRRRGRHPPGTAEGVHSPPILSPLVLTAEAALVGVWSVGAAGSSTSGNGPLGEERWPLWPDLSHCVSSDRRSGKRCAERREDAAGRLPHIVRYEV